MALGLGPVARVVEYDPHWPRLFEEERARVSAAIGDWTEGIEHVGSTAVPGLPAKPILDVLVGLRTLSDALRCIPRLEAIGYEYVPEYERELPQRRYFRKGPREDRTHHIHMVVRGGDFWRSHVAFRDWLRAYPEDAAAYARVKRDLVSRFGGDRDAYTEGKREFIEAILEKALAAGY